MYVLVYLKEQLRSNSKDLEIYLKSLKFTKKHICLVSLILLLRFQRSLVGNAKKTLKCLSRRIHSLGTFELELRSKKVKMITIFKRKFKF